MDDGRRQAWQEWCDERVASVRAIPGNLALVAYQPVGDAPEPIQGIDGSKVRRAADRPGVYLTAKRELGVTVGDDPVDGEIFVPRAMPVDPVFIRHGRRWMDAFSLDGSDYELRIYDEDADNLAAFDDIEVYDYDPDAALVGHFEAFEAVGQVAWEFTRVEDSGHTKNVPGTVVVMVGGSERRLSAFLDGDNLVLVFADGTTGVESYGPGRFLVLPQPSDDGRIEVDFNRAFIPPCGFSDFYSCPVPPPENRFGIPIRAGEQRVRWRTGS